MFRQRALERSSVRAGKRLEKLLALPLLLLAGMLLFAQHASYSNPLLPSGADPWVIQQDSWYYYTHTTGKNLTIWKTHDVTDLRHAQSRIVWSPPALKAWSKDIWAPELHRLEGKWYLYFAADDGQNRNHRLYVLENPASDPLTGDWVLKGQVATPEDRWAIDATVFTVARQNYLAWSGWPESSNGRQDIYLARLKNPWTTEGPRIAVSTPTLPWETIGSIAHPGPDDTPHVSVNEGPEALLHGNRVMIVYSASGCWTDSYALGLVWAPLSADLLQPSAWTKLPQPVFIGGNGVYAPGHNSFFTSPDGREDWILYHANSSRGKGCGASRSPHAQRFSWSPEGFPVFGAPLPEGSEAPLPSGTPVPAA